MNVVALVGNLATDPEIRTTGTGKSVCSFRLAVSRPGSTDADFLTVVTWDRQADVCKEYLSVGRRVAVDGRLHHSTWEVAATDSTPAQRRSKVEVVAHRVQMLDKPKRETTPAVDEDFAPRIDADADSPVAPEFSVV